MSATILPFDRRSSEDTIATLEALLTQARSGAIYGLAFIVKYAPTQHEPGVTGDYRRDPTAAVGAAMKLVDALSQM